MYIIDTFGLGVAEAVKKEIDPHDCILIKQSKSANLERSIDLFTKYLWEKDKFKCLEFANQIWQSRIELDMNIRWTWKKDTPIYDISEIDPKNLEYIINILSREQTNLRHRYGRA